MKNSFSELKLDELLAKRDELRKKYFDLRFQLVVGHVENPLEKRNLRRQIARVETLIGERQRTGGSGAVVTSAAVGGATVKAAKPKAVKTAKPKAVKAATPVARGAK